MYRKKEPLKKLSKEAYLRQGTVNEIKKIYKRKELNAPPTIAKVARIKSSALKKVPVPETFLESLIETDLSSRLEDASEEKSFSPASVSPTKFKKSAKMQKHNKIRREVENARNIKEIYDNLEHDRNLERIKCENKKEEEAEVEIKKEEKLKPSINKINSAREREREENEMLKFEKKLSVKKIKIEKHEQIYQKKVKPFVDKEMVNEQMKARKNFIIAKRIKGLD